ncbi:MAG: hypothetical protein IPK00_15610 [Deltaproteobacteria bacterium]|nr:hypothetical protein [Deltaproteobacteria bacterium]
MAANTMSAMALRELEIRSRALPLAAQMNECVDLLQSPELVVDELLRSIEQIRSAGPDRDRVVLARDPVEPTEGAFFYPSRELFVRGDRCSFTCLATGVAFRPGGPNPPPATPGRTAGHAIDYAAVTCEARPVPVLGFTAARDTDSAYPILLRSLASLIELTRPRRFDLLDREIYRGLLGPAPAFELALVLWDEDDPQDPRRPLCELSRDLAEVLKKTLQAEPRFPPVLLDFVCLRMNAKRFDGRLRFVWRV